MARREPKGPYMIYNGPIPEAVKARLAQAAAERAEAGISDEPDDEETSAPALIMLLLGVLAVGLALGLWLRPTLDHALGHGPPALARAALAITPPGQPSLPPAAVQIDTSAIDVPPAPEKPNAAAAGLQIATAQPPPATPARASHPAVATPAAPAKAADKAGTKVADNAASAPSCAPGGSKADQMVCADPTLAAAERQLRQSAERAAYAGGEADQVDWLVTREAAARRSPQALKEAYQRHIAELEGLAEPPH